MPRSVACHYCKLKKIRCCGAQPCSNCRLRQEACEYPQIQERKSRSALIENTKVLEQRLAQVEGLLHQSQKRRIEPSEDEHAMRPAPGPIPDIYRSANDYGNEAVVASLPELPNFQPGEEYACIVSNAHDPFFADSYPMMTQDGVFDWGVLDLEKNSFSVVVDDALSTSENAWSGANKASSIALSAGSATSGAPLVPASTVLPCPTERPSSGSSWAPVNHSANSQRRGSILESYPADEPYVLGPLLSVCSPSGIRWVAEQIGTPDFQQCANFVTTYMRGKRRHQWKFQSTPEPEPSEETAWKYCTAYFEDSVASDIGVVDRHAFEDRLRAQFQTFPQGQPASVDPAWYALRNAVYASGCTAESTKASCPDGFEEAQERGWRFFDNALSVQGELLYGQTDITAMEALVAMCYFAEGQRHPLLESILCSNAVTLAQAKGLHSRDTESNEAQLQRQQWLFWAIYCYSSHLSGVSGRCTATLSDDIECEMPTTQPIRSAISVECFTIIVTLHKIASRIFRSIQSMKAADPTTEEVISFISRFHTQLTAWRDSLPSAIRPDASIAASQIPPGYHLSHLVYLNFTYYGALISLHSILVYPWRQSPLGSSGDSNVAGQVAKSTNTIIGAARNMIIAVKHISISASLPGWLLLYYPLAGFMNVFVHVLRNPLLPSSESDIALMDMVVGHFGYLGFLSESGRTLSSCLRQIVMIASTFTIKARARQQAQMQPQNAQYSAAH